MNSSITLVFGASFIATGCANMSSIHHMDKLDTASPNIVSVDSDQRFLVTNLVLNGREPGVTDYRVCAEQFPDTFSTQSGSTSGALSWLPGVGGNEVATQASSSFGETAASMSRTQTVNLLRESMYRTCERYLNGAITQEQMDQQASRDAMTMVSILAIEQLTGSITPNGVGLSSESNGLSAGASVQVVEAVSEAKTDFDAAQLRFDIAKTSFDGYELGASESCQSLEAGARAAEVANCQAAKTEFTEAKSELEVQKEHYNLVTRLAGGFASTRSSSNATVLANGGSGARSLAERSGEVAAVAAAVVEIVRITSGANASIDCDRHYRYLRTSLKADPTNRVNYLDALPAACRNEKSEHLATKVPPTQRVEASFDGDIEDM